MAVRELFRYPPFSHMAKLLFSGKDTRKTKETAEGFHQALLRLLPSQFEFQPVIPCGYAKIKDLYRYQFLIRGPTMLPLHEALKKLEESQVLPRQVKVFVDVNPSSTFF